MGVDFGLSQLATTSRVAEVLERRVASPLSEPQTNGRQRKLAAQARHIWLKHKIKTIPGASAGEFPWRDTLVRGTFENHLAPYYERDSRTVELILPRFIRTTAAPWW